ncbi:MAG: TOPRIM nucleotidyl transferase/hydrolase domain-containing protein, partial [Nocardioides sp.]
MRWSPEPDDTRAVVLVEGASDQRALEVLARRHGVSLADIEVVSMAGITNVPAHLLLAGSRRVALLYDMAESAYVDPKLSAHPAVDGFGCTDDLEHELLRALTLEAVEGVIAGEGELASLRLLQRQPAQRDRSSMQHLRRFISSHSGRKLRYAELLSDAVDLASTPTPLLGLLR